MSNPTTIEVAAFIDTDGHDRKTWTAQGIGPALGLTAVGNSFFDARRGLAEIVALAITNDVIDIDTVPAEIRVLATTRKTFNFEELVKENA